MSDKDIESVNLERTSTAPIDLIWQMWTEAEHFQAWYGPDGVTIPFAEMDVKVGGKRRISMELQTPDGPMPLWFAGEYREVVENQRLVYTEALSDEEGILISPAELGLPDDHQTTTNVVVELVSGDAETKISLTHLGVPAGSPGEAGWSMALDKLIARLDAQE